MRPASGRHGADADASVCEIGRVVCTVGAGLAPARCSTCARVGGRPCFPPMGEVYTVGAGLAPPVVRRPSMSRGRPASPDGGGLHRRGGACRRPLFDMCPCPTGGGSSPPYRQLAGSLPPPPPGEAEDALRRGELRSPGGGGRGGRSQAAPTGPPCHCEERSDAAIRSLRARSRLYTTITR